MRIALLAVLVALAVPAVASAYAAFRTPGNRAYCGLTEGAPPVTLTCWHGGFGVSTWMLPTGKAHVARSKGARDNLAPVLRFGHTWRASGYRCTSASGGLTCTNSAGHGWWLGRSKRYRLR